MAERCSFACWVGAGLLCLVLAALALLSGSVALFVGGVVGATWCAVVLMTWGRG